MKELLTKRFKMLLREIEKNRPKIISSPGMSSRSTAEPGDPAGLSRGRSPAHQASGVSSGQAGLHKSLVLASLKDSRKDISLRTLDISEAG
jgi:hypothetical protein